MNLQEFVTELKKELEFEESLTLDTKLKELDDWDSMSAMVLIGYVSENFNKNLTTDDLKKMTTINSLVDIIGREQFN